MPMHHLHKKFILTICLLLILMCLMMPPGDMISDFYYYIHPEKSIQCYRSGKSHSLPDIATATPPPPKGRSIFFHETSCSSHFSGKIVIGRRQACAVESAARLNPNMAVFLLFASPGGFRFAGTESDRQLQALLRYENVHIHHVDYERYTRDTPVETLYRTGRIERSGFAQSHASDVLRFLTLWKYGGVYLDLDVVVVKSLEGLGDNYAGSESDTNVAAGVLNFSPTGLGHRLARHCLDDLKNNFQGNDWGYNGPGVITRLLKEVCGEDQAKNMVSKDCQGFRVFPPETFYPIPWWNWTMYFAENSARDVLNVSRHSHIIHVWNKHSVHQKIPIANNQVPYISFAQQYCPRVFEECDEYF